MNVLGVVYQHSWVITNVEASFPLHLEIIISFYYVLHWAFELLMVAPLDKLKLESQAFFLRQLFSTNVFKVLKKDDKYATI
jgi:hypothetical protein